MLFLVKNALTGAYPAPSVFPKNKKSGVTSSQSIQNIFPDVPVPHQTSSNIR